MEQPPRKRRKPYNKPVDRVVPKRIREKFQGNHEIEPSRKNVLGHYTGCRHYRSIEGKDGISVDCIRHGLRDDCGGCYVCPKCGGQLYLDATTAVQGFQRYRVEDKACMQCGARYPEAMKLVREKVFGREKKDPFPPRCQVEGCQRRTWEGLMFHGFRICFYHHEMVGEKKKRQPLVVVEGKLIHNPASDSRRKRGEMDAPLARRCECGGKLVSEEGGVRCTGKGKHPSCGYTEPKEPRVNAGSIPRGKSE